jgi:sugar phosphate isomerase/epimerase
MKTLILALLSVATLSAATVSDHIGLQMYSLRVQLMKQGWRPALDQAKAFGFTAIEGGAPPSGVTVDQYKAELASRGMKMVGMGFAYETLAQDLAGSVATAKALGVQYVMVAWIPHKDDTFTAELAAKAASDFNAWGAAFRAAGISFVYHAHGYEFRPLAGGGTLFDSIVRTTNREDVNFEMDVFWVTHGGQDPAALLRKYPDRWSLMHVKDIRKGAPTGIYTGHAPATDDVPVGSGQVNWRSVLAEAKADGVQWYFIEDESTTPLENIPQSVAYLKSLGM